MNIFFLINTLRSGGAQQALSSITKSFDKSKKKIFLIIINKKDRKDAKVLNKNIEIIYLNKKISNFIPILLSLFFLIIKIKPKYFISTGNAETIIYGRIISFITKTYHISWVQFDYLNSKPIFFLKQILWHVFFKKLFFIDKNIIVISKFLFNRYYKDFHWDKNKLTIIPNTFSSFFLNKKKRYKLKKFILCPGRLDYDKNHLTIIKALFKLKKKFSNFKCVFIGEKGNAYQDILDSIKKLNLKNNIIIKKFISASNFINLLYSAHLVVLISKKEPFGVLALETMFLKKNFIISNNTGFKDIIGDINLRNIVKNPNNHIEIFNKIIDLYRKPLLAREKNIFYMRANHFECNVVHNQWLKILR